MIRFLPLLVVTMLLVPHSFAIDELAPTTPPPGGRNPAEEVRTKAEKLIDEIAFLKNQGRLSEADSMQQELSGLLREHDPDIARLRDLQKQIAAARLEGRHEEADQLSKQADDLNIAMFNRYGTPARKPQEAKGERKTMAAEDLEQIISRLKTQYDAAELAATELAKLIRTRPNTNESAQQRQRLQTEIQRAFEARAEMQTRQLDLAEANLQRARERLLQRRQIADKIVERRVKELLAANASADNNDQPLQSYTIRLRAPSTARVRTEGPNGAGKSKSELIVSRGAEERIAVRRGYLLHLQMRPTGNSTGKQVTGTIRIDASSKAAESFARHNTIAVTIEAEDVEQAMTGKIVTKVISLTDGGALQTLNSYRIDPGIDAITAARRQGNILAVLRLTRESAMQFEQPTPDNEPSAEPGTASVMLGIEVEMVPPDTFADLNDPSGDQVRGEGLEIIHEPNPQGLAGQAGLHKGDLLVAGIDRWQTTTHRELDIALDLAMKSKTQPTRFHVLREGQMSFASYDFSGHQQRLQKSKDELIQMIEDARSSLRFELEQKEKQYANLIQFGKPAKPGATQTGETKPILEALTKLSIERTETAVIASELDSIEKEKPTADAKVLYTRLQTLLGSPTNFPDAETSPEALIRFARTSVDQQLRTFDGRKKALEKLLDQTESVQRYKDWETKSKGLRAEIERARQMIEELSSKIRSIQEPGDSDKTPAR